MPAPKGNKSAEKYIDWDKIDELLKIGANQIEIAAILSIDVDTLTNHCKREKGMLFSEYIEKGMTTFKIGIRRAQMRAAVGTPRTKIDPNTGREVIDGWVQQPSVVMQIWLGKQYLDQKDKVEMKNENYLYTGFDIKGHDSDTGNG